MVAIEEMQIAYGSFTRERGLMAEHGNASGRVAVEMLAKARWSRSGRYASGSSQAEPAPESAVAIWWTGRNSTRRA